MTLAPPHERNIAREREIAWRKHEPLRSRVPYFARRTAEQFRESIAPDAGRIKRVYSSTSFRALLKDWARQASLGRSHAIKRVASAIAPASAEAIGGMLRLLWLESRGQLVQLDDPRYAQNCVLVVGAVIRRSGRTLGAASGFPVLECSEHSLRRLCERAPHIDVKAALLEAACAFLAADFRTVEAQRLKGGTVCLKAGPGLLLTEVLYCADLEKKPRLFSRANTWISWATAEPDQRPIAAAVDPAATMLAVVAR
jgi:hypothetical protein